ncbi:serine hydrolase [Flavilitoribacter nigricans DSM 23189 = NBRC 102662]|uniref:Serine hydrolase n=2 Tax=Flavilitoribacter TaxID=2762562 RepID=A0A2D0MZP1_FLAN2|nr:serine hydrolase [Flavilitoribacter nigricans DSM 23189 = NBRC 102662]
MTTPDPDPEPEGLYFPPLDGNDWATQSPASLGWNTAKIPDLLQFLEDGNTRAFIVLKDGKIVLEEYFGKDLLGIADFSAGSNWYWASAAKTLTAFTVGLAQEEGHLNIADRSDDYLGEQWADISDVQMKAITVRHHLTMTTGLDDSVDNKDCTEPECLVYLADAGTRWAYHNAPYTILDQVVEGATQQNFDDYFHSRLTSRIGMDGFWTYVDYNHLYFSTARSMARFGLLNLNKGKWDDTPIMTDANYYEEMVNTSQDINPSYGYLWWLNGKSAYKLPGFQIRINGSIAPDAPADMFAGLGKNGQYLNIVPSQNLIVIRMGENPSNALVPIVYLNDLWKMLNEIIR